MATDSRITYRLDPMDPLRLGFEENVEKICRFEGTNVAVSYWGQAGFEGKPMLKILKEFGKSRIKAEDDVNSVAEKMKTYFEKIAAKTQKTVGLHVAGYTKDAPKLRHVFHEIWHDAGEFVNEDCHTEYHLAPNGDRVRYRAPKDYPVLFNGDNLVANALFNYAHTIQPYYDIIPHKLDLGDCIELAKLIVSTSIHRLNYYFDQSMQQSKVPKTVAGPIYIATIRQKEGFELKKYEKDI